MKASVEEKHIHEAAEASDFMIANSAMEATRCAYARALRFSSQGVLRIKDGDLVRVSSDGGTTMVRKGKPRRKVSIGQVVTVRAIKSTMAGQGA